MVSVTTSGKDCRLLRVCPDSRCDEKFACEHECSWRWESNRCGRLGNRVLVCGHNVIVGQDLFIDLTLAHFLINPELGDILPISIPIVLRPPFRQSGDIGPSVLFLADSRRFTLEITQAVDIAVTLSCIRAVYSMFAEDN